MVGRGRIFDVLRPHQRLVPQQVRQSRSIGRRFGRRRGGRRRAGRGSGGVARRSKRRGHAAVHKLSPRISRNQRCGTWVAVNDTMHSLYQSPAQHESQCQMLRDFSQLADKKMLEHWIQPSNQTDDTINRHKASPAGVGTCCKWGGWQFCAAT